MYVIRLPPLERLTGLAAGVTCCEGVLKIDGTLETGLELSKEGTISALALLLYVVLLTPLERSTGLTAGVTCCKAFVNSPFFLATAVGLRFRIGVCIVAGALVAERVFLDNVFAGVSIVWIFFIGLVGVTEGVK